MRKYSKIVCAIFIFLLLFNLSGCKNKQQNKHQKKPQTSQKTEVPKELSKIEKDIEKIIKEAQKIKEKPQSDQEKQSDKEKKDKKEEDKKSPKKTPEDKSWEEINKAIKNIHTDWNSLTPLVTKEGAKLNLINSMGAAINDLTIIANKKSKIDVLIYANNVYKYIPDLEDLFQSEAPTDIKRLKFYAQDIAFKSEVQKWEEISKDLIDINSVWQTLKPKLPKEAKNSADKFEAGVAELQKAIKSQNKVLTKIKSDVLLQDIKSLEQTAKPKK
ncbi:hypothetical protein SAMN02745195_01959 [Thermoanaerobacter uzonensis DSM 18761]|uniref:Lipoprotein n=1 Tax=Thermoanaerobacter uzonensis DSM 18761 TaxID=1123369 RepID=A0A1M4ZCL4_9THEO|nr:hypothetical protein [Thermoanaerobacter uzonensis]SHF15784.1 hypothetical protein SAMN02745195_01959 [Thermoanaerobacter uzonensis DSM 18761]